MDIQSLTYTSRQFYECRQNYVPLTLPHESLEVFKMISEDTRTHISLRKRSKRKNHITNNKPSWRAKPSIFQQDDLSHLDKMLKQITKLLNKLSHPNVCVITEEINKIFNENREKIDLNLFTIKFSEKLFEKALREPLFYKDYVFLLDKLIIELDDDNKKLIDTIQTLSQLLLKNFLNQFESDNEGLTEFEIKISNDIQLEDLIGEDFKGLCFLISELYLHQHLGLSIITDGLNKLKDFLDADHDDFDKIVQHYCHLCTPLLHSEFFPIENYLESLPEWKKNSKLPSKTRFMVMDLLETFEKIEV